MFSKVNLNTFAILRWRYKGCFIFFSYCLSFFYGQVRADEIELKSFASRDDSRFVVTSKIIRWESSSTQRNPLSEDRCQGATGFGSCSIGLSAYLIDKNGQVVNGHQYSMFQAQNWMHKSKTMADLVRAANQNGLVGKSISQSVGYGMTGLRACVYLGYIPHTGGGLIRFANSPPDECSYSEFLPNVCKISEDNIYIRHGTLSSNRVNGHSASTTLHVSCDRDMSVRIRPERPQDYIVLDAVKGLRSYISINGKTMGGDGVVVNATTGGGSAVNITSTLANHRGQEGNFSGAMVLVVAME